MLTKIEVRKARPINPLDQRDTRSNRSEPTDILSSRAENGKRWYSYTVIAMITTPHWGIRLERVCGIIDLYQANYISE